jgi:hypothetical protein
MADVSNPQDFSLADAPGGDLSFDDLFPADGDNTVLATPVAEPPATPPAPEPPQAPPAAAQFHPIRTPTGSVYESEEDLIRGISHKDETIERLRQRHIASTGIDPLTERPVTREPQTPVPANYAAEPEKFYDDLVSAVNKGDRRQYASIYQKFFNDMAAPLIPVLATNARSQALDAVSAEIKDYREFARSNAYSEVLEKEPLLKAAISNAETNLGLSQELPGLYRLAYWAAQGRKAPEIVRTAAVNTAPPSNPPPARPTTTPSTMTPPALASAPDLRTPEGRKAIMERFNAAGGMDKVF